MCDGRLPSRFANQCESVDGKITKCRNDDRAGSSKVRRFDMLHNVKLMISVLPTFTSSSYGNDSYMCVIATYE